MANQPTQTLRDGSLKATIWSNPNEKGHFYSVTLTRSYTDAEGNWHETSSFSGSEVLRISRLADQAYGAMQALKREDRNQVPAEI